MPDMLAAMAARGVVRKYRKGTLLIQEGDRGDLLYLILIGRVKVFSADADGHEITYAVLRAGEYFGEMSLDGGPRSASVITTEATECAVLDFSAVKALLTVNPEFGLHLLGTVIRRAREATEAARALAQDGVYRRLKSFLERSMVAEAGKDGILLEKVTQREIAARIGCGREMVSRVLKDLEAGGYVLRGVSGVRVVKKLPARW